MILVLPSTGVPRVGRSDGVGFSVFAVFLVRRRVGRSDFSTGGLVLSVGRSVGAFRVDFFLLPNPYGVALPIGEAKKRGTVKSPFARRRRRKFWSMTPITLFSIIFVTFS